MFIEDFKLIFKCNVFYSRVITQNQTTEKRKLLVGRKTLFTEMYLCGHIIIPFSHEFWDVSYNCVPKNIFIYIELEQNLNRNYEFSVLFSVKPKLVLYWVVYP